MVDALFLVDTGGHPQLLSHEHRSGFNSTVIKSGQFRMFLEKLNISSLCFQICSETRRQRKQKHGFEPSPSIETDA